MIRKLLFASALAIPLFCVTASAQTADEIVNKSIEARGGREKLKAVNSVVMTGTATVGPGITAPATLTVRRPSSFRLDLTIQGMSLTQATDGSTAWMVNPFAGASTAQPMPAEDAADFNEDADIDGALVDYKEKGHTVELLGKEDFEGTPAYKLKLTLKSGAVQTIYLDASTFLELKVVGKRKQQGTEVEVESYPSNYKPVNGVLYPFSLEAKANGQTQFQLALDKIEVNKPVEDTVFKMPAK
jgi:outer membrane lipoprotein-sorting protein